MAERPALRSLAERVGLWMKVLRSLSPAMVDDTAASSAWTLLRTWGDFASAALYTALEYLRAMAEAARWPRPGTMLAALRNIIEVQERDCD